MQQSKTDFALELARLDAEYRQRDYGKVPVNRYSLFNESTLLHSQSLERNLLRLFKKHSFTNLAEKKILDVGCGNGGQLGRFLHYGALPTNLFGLDLMAHRIEQAQNLHPTINWHIGSAHQIPYPDATFDLVMSFVVFSSILDESLRQRIVDEMWRVLKPEGLLLFYDFTFSNPRNPAVAGVSQREIQQLFSGPGVCFDFRRITLAPPISRMVAPRAYWLASLLERCKVLNTHVLCIISKEEEAIPSSQKRGSIS